MKALNTKTLKKFLETIGNKMTGDWILLGGTLLPACGINVRSTMDIDVVSLGGTNTDQRVQLMEIAEDLGLPVTAINQAADFFLEKIKYTEKDLILLFKGKKAKIFRPSSYLYWRLKIARLSETDLVDCEHYLRFCLAQNDLIVESDLSKLITKKLKIEKSVDRVLRLQKLKSLLKTIN